jgi:hypothetical protein
MPAGLIAAVGGAASAAALAGTAVTAGTAIAGAVGGSGAQSSDIAGGQAAANAEQQAAINQYNVNEQPYLSTGTNALSGLGDALGLNGSTGYANALSNFQASPGYQYDLSQGLSAVDDGAASTGTLRSGNTIRAEETLGSNLANQDFGSYLGRLNSLASLGQTATSALGSSSVSTAQGIANTDTSAATSQAKIDGQTANSLSSAVGSVASSKGVQNALTSAFTPAPTATPTGAANPTGQGL